MEFFLLLAVGIVCIFLGIFNRRGNISSIHSYHRRRVSEQDILPFGRMMGLGTIVVGVGMIVCGAFEGLAQFLELPLLAIVGTVIIIVSILVGLGISFYAMIKYNKGIF